MASDVERDGYADAFYEIGQILGIGAQAKSPRDVWEQQMKPRLLALAAASTDVRDAVLAEREEVAQMVCEYAFDREGSWAGQAAEEIADAIRARPSPEPSA